jgi:hypothetical protein
LSLRRQAANAGPGINLLLCGLTDPLLSQRVRALDPTQPVFRDLDDSMGAIDDLPTTARRLYRRLPPGIEAPVQAGVIIAEACATWGLPHVVFPGPRRHVRPVSGRTPLSAR